MHCKDVDRYNAYMCVCVCVDEEAETILFFFPEETGEGLRGGFSMDTKGVCVCVCVRLLCGVSGCLSLSPLSSSFVSCGC